MAIGDFINEKESDAEGVKHKKATRMDSEEHDAQDYITSLEEYFDANDIKYEMTDMSDKHWVAFAFYFDESFSALQTINYYINLDDRNEMVTYVEFISPVLLDDITAVKRYESFVAHINRNSRFFKLVMHFHNDRNSLFLQFQTAYFFPYAPEEVFEIVKSLKDDVKKTFEALTYVGINDED